MRASSAGDLCMRQALTRASPETIGRGVPEAFCHVIDDEIARRRLDGERAWRPAMAHRAGQERERALVLMPGPNVGIDLQCLLDGRLLEERRDDDGLAFGRDQRRGGALRAPPANAGEVFQGGARFDQEGGDFLLLHQRLQLREPGRVLFRRRSAWRLR